MIINKTITGNQFSSLYKKLCKKSKNCEDKGFNKYDSALMDIDYIINRYSDIDATDKKSELFDLLPSSKKDEIVKILKEFI